MSLKENNRLAFFQTSLHLLSLVQFVKCRQIFMDWNSMLIILSGENKVLTFLSYLMTLYKFKTNKQTNKEKQVDKNLLLPATGMGFFFILFLFSLLALAVASSTYKRK